MYTHTNGMKYKATRDKDDHKRSSKEREISFARYQAKLHALMPCLEAWVRNEAGRKNIASGERAQQSKGPKVGKHKSSMENK